MYKKYSAIANINESGLTRGKEYFIENTGSGSVYVYDIDGSYLTCCRKDSFDNWIPIINQ